MFISRGEWPRVREGGLLRIMQTNGISMYMSRARPSSRSTFFSRRPPSLSAQTGETRAAKWSGSNLLYFPTFSGPSVVQGLRVRCGKFSGILWWRRSSSLDHLAEVWNATSSLRTWSRKNCAWMNGKKTMCRVVWLTWRGMCLIMRFGTSRCLLKSCITAGKLPTATSSPSVFRERRRMESVLSCVSCCDVSR